MAVTITNRTSRPVYVALHSGDTLRLSPGCASGSVNEVEVKGNATVEKLLRQRMISVDPLKTDRARTEALVADASASDDSEARSRTRKKA